MPQAYPSIQSFFQPEVQSSMIELRGLPHQEPGDGFTSSEIEATLNPLKRDFNPDREYEELDIGELQPGPLAVMFVGRIVNFRTYFGKSKSQSAAKGWHHLVVRDEIGVVGVTLYFGLIPYKLHLGLLITVWTAFISAQSSQNENQFVSSIPLRTSIFPGRDPSVHIILHSTVDSGRFRTPLAYRPWTKTLPGLVTLQSWLNGAHEVADVKVLVCVKSMGPKKSITSKTGKSLELREVKVHDDTGETALKLWNENTASIEHWVAGKTILLISEPGYRFSWGKAYITIEQKTVVDVEPEFTDAGWIRRWAAQLNKRDSLKQEVEEGLFDLKAFEEGADRPLFTIGEVDKWARKYPQREFMGCLSLVLLEMELSLWKRRNMLMCSECCGVPIYASALTSLCSSCSKNVELVLNPKIIGTLVDGSGCVAGSNMIWKKEAWEMLFGRSIEELIEMDDSTMRRLEQRMLYLRYTVPFGWSERVGKLVVLGVRE